MNSEIDVLSILAEVTIAFVAFSTIVATIKLSIGGELTPYQRILIHYFTESSMLMLSILLLALVLIARYPNQEIFVATVVLRFSFFTMAGYLFWYLRRRTRLKIPTAPISLVVIVGYFILISLIGVSISPFMWLPAVAHISYIALWNFVSCAMIFSVFLGSFIDAENKEQRAN